MAAQLGYQYLQSRSPGKKTEKQTCIGILICSEIEDYYRTAYGNPGFEWVRGISEFAQLHDWRLDIHFVSPLAKDISHESFAKIKALKKRSWSGLLLLFPFPLEVVTELATQFPCVSLGERYAMGVDCVDVNDGEAISLLLNRLKRYGPEIGFLSRRYPTQPSWSLRRYGAYVENLARLGFPFREENAIFLDATSLEKEMEGYDLLVERIAKGVKTWLCAADHLAYDLIHQLKSRGLKVPGDAAVTGFDASPRPPGAPLLETVQVPHREIGYSASRRLLEKIDRRFDATQEILLSGRLKEGETVDELVVEGSLSGQPISLTGR